MACVLESHQNRKPTSRFLPGPRFCLSQQQDKHGDRPGRPLHHHQRHQQDGQLAHLFGAGLHLLDDHMLRIHHLLFNSANWAAITTKFSSDDHFQMLNLPQIPFSPSASQPPCDANSILTLCVTSNKNFTFYHLLWLWIAKLSRIFLNVSDGSRTKMT